MRDHRTEFDRAYHSGQSTFTVLVRELSPDPRDVIVLSSDSELESDDEISDGKIPLLNIFLMFFP